MEIRLKANNEKGNNETRDEWETPSWIFNPLMEQYSFEFDCAASQNNSKCKSFASLRLPFELSTFIKGVAWMNPPFSKAYAMFRHFFKVIKRGVAIYRCDNLETALWQKEILSNCSWIFIPDRRVSYEGLDGAGVRFPSALIGIGLDIPKGLKGTILEVKPKSSQD